MLDDLSTDELLAEIHEAAVFPDRWPMVLAGPASTFDADTAGLCALAPDGRRVFSVVAGAAPEPCSRGEGGGAIDRRVGDGAGRAPGTVFTRGPSARRRRTIGAPAVAEGAFPGRLMGLVVERDAEATTLLYITRHAPDSGFSRADRARLSRLGPHLRRARTGAARMADANLVRHAALSVLERAAVGLIVLDAEMRIRATNATADALLVAADGLLRRGERLETGGDRRASTLERALCAATGAEPCNANGAGIALTLPRGAARRPLEVLIVPLPAATDSAAERGGALVLIGAPEGRPAMVAETLQRLYGLSPAEAELAAGLASGLSLAQFAEETERTVGTARKTLKRVFAKTETGRQGELIQRLLSGPAGLAVETGRPH